MSSKEATTAKKTKARCGLSPLARHAMVSGDVLTETSVAGRVELEPSLPFGHLSPKLPAIGWPASPLTLALSPAFYGKFTP